jgi:AraC family transcriptional regulator
MVIAWVKRGVIFSFIPQTGYTQTDDTDYELYFENGLFCELWVSVKQI